MDIPKPAQQLIKLIEQHGEKAYIVGGYIRDSLLGKASNDIDIATSAHPEELKKILQNYNIIETGIKHGTISVIIDGVAIEITTFRIDGAYLDQRRPDKVSFVKSLEEDLKRRDFTINALAYNPKTGIIDYQGGKNHIENKIIQTVGDPDKRLKEDALRILRALRFASELGFSIESQTQKSLHKNKDLLKTISFDRKLSELKKLLQGSYLKEVILNYSDIIDLLIPNLQLTKSTPSQLKQKALSTQNTKPLFHLRLAMLINQSNIHPSKIDQTLKRLKIDKKTHSQVLTLTNHIKEPLKNTDSSIKKWLNLLGEDAFLDLLELKKANYLSQNPYQEGKIEQIQKIQSHTLTIIQKGECTSLKQLKINGKDLIELGFCQSTDLGNLLDDILEMVITNKLPNTKTDLIAYAKTKL